ncbi:MAG: DinB family protein [Phycisphaerae bacterium]|nr:DinB family protein [Phycisphaerae bacterium]
MPTATLSRFAPIVVPQLRLALGYAAKLVADVPADRFAHMPAPKVNHPAFNIGHLAIYPERVLEVVGRRELAAPDERFVELFKAGTPCVEQDGRYPAKDEIMKRFNGRWELVAATLPEIPDERFAEANPLEGRMRELLPTIGAMVNFLCGSHLQMHLGQVSVWRRLMGLGPVI